MARKYKRNSKGQFAGGGGTGRLNKALASVGVRRRTYQRAIARQKAVDNRRVSRQLQTLLRQEKREGS